MAMMFVTSTNAMDSRVTAIEATKIVATEALRKAMVSQEATAPQEATVLILDTVAMEDTVAILV